MSTLKDIRESVGLSQKQLSLAAEIPIRTLQEYEQGTRNINNASAFTVFRLACALTAHGGVRQYTVEDLLDVKRGNNNG